MMNRLKIPATTLLKMLRRVALLFVMLAGLPYHAHAQESNWVGDPAIAEARLISAVTATGELDALPIGLEIRMAPGWKVYWRTPGEAGLPPLLDFSHSAYPDVTAIMQWPAPKRFNAFGFDNFGYQDHVIFPMTVSGHVSGGLAQLRAGLEALACADICVPLAGDLSIVIPDGPQRPSIHARSIAEYTALVPRLADDTGMAATGPSLRVGAADYSDTDITITMAADGPRISDAFIEGFENIAFRAPTMRGDSLVIPYELSKNATFSGGEGRITLIATGETGETGEFPLTILPQGVTKGAALSGLTLSALFIAFLGGLILNLMPCVLPVLAIKLSSVLSVIGRARAEIRLRFLAGAAGILTSFVLLAAILATLKAGGASIGWGIQFQNAYFIGGMILLLGLFATSLAGLVTFQIPVFAQRAAQSSHGGRASGLSGDFLSGMLATILATPCSAPFVGTAVTIAFSGSTIDLFGIFVAMGLGLAAPWLVVAMVPSAVHLLPKPGPWFKWLKAALVAMLVGTMIWLGTVFAALVAPGTTSTATDWQSWQPGIAAPLVAEGKIVFIDVTADWCITCKANKALVLDQPPVAAALATAVAAGDLVMLQADWTSPNADIAAFLAQHQRFGIPFNIIFSPAYPEGIILPELLRSEGVLSALEKARQIPK